MDQTERSCNDFPALVRGVNSGQCAFEQLVERLLPAIDGTEKLPAETLLELSTALLDFEKAAVREDRLFALVNDENSATIALGDSGQILTMNAAATMMFKAVSGDGLSALNLRASDFAALKRRLVVSPGLTLLRLHPSSLRKESAPIVMVVSYHPQFRAFVLSALKPGWPASIDLAMKELFSLTNTECEVLAHLANGDDSAEIARLRNRSVGTVRQQIKTLLSKLGCKSQLSAATLAASAASTANAASLGNIGGKVPASVPGWLPVLAHDYPLTVFSMERDGRRIGYRSFGKSGGRTVLFMHGPSFGAGEYAADRRLAERYGLQVFAAERPGYGRTEPVPAGERPLACEYHDAMALVRRENLKSFFIMAHESALIPALEVAVREPVLCSGILAVSSSPPFLRLEQISALPSSQSIYIHAARQADWMSRLLIKILTVRMRRLGPQNWTDVIFGEQAIDRTVMARPALASGVIASYSFYLNQLGAGFEHDLRLMLEDWTDNLRAVRVPLFLVHGERNTTTPLRYLDILRQLRPDIQIELAPDAGLSLAVSHPQLIYRKLAALLDSCQGSAAEG